ncbi:MAG: glycosyltransferase 87 family protein [Nitrososphaerota archaeon]
MDSKPLGGRLLEAVAFAVPYIAAASWALSLFLHVPGQPWTVYSDVASFWYREEHLRNGEVPCIGYFLEYPPVACYLVYLARLAGGPELLPYYFAFGLISLPAYAVLAYSTSGLNLNQPYLPLIALLSPSLVMYGIYNFDHFFAALLALSLLLFTRGRHALGSAVLGVAAATKLMSVLILPLYLMEARGERKRVFVAFVAGALIPSLPVLLLNPGWVTEFVRYHSGWGLENAWYVWIFGDPFSPTAKLFGLALFVPLLLRSYSLRSGLLEKSAMAIGSWLLTSYVFTPQMVIWMVPFVAALPPLLVLWPAFEISNVYILLTWFTTDRPTHPWTLPQTMALVRAAALAGMLYLLYRNAKSRESSPAITGTASHPTSSSGRS